MIICKIIKYLNMISIWNLVLYIFIRFLLFRTMSLFDWLTFESWGWRPCHLFYSSIGTAIILVLFTNFYKYKHGGISDTNYEDNINKINLLNVSTSSRLPYQPELKIVTDPGKALAQMVKFKLRFHRKVKRFRERKEMENNSTKEDLTCVEK